MLTELDAFVAARLSARANLPMFILDSLSIGTIVMIVIYVSMFGWIFQRICVVRSHFYHFVFTSQSGYRLRQYQ
jgi:hypothetical protein